MDGCETPAGKERLRCACVLTALTKVSMYGMVDVHWQRDGGGVGPLGAFFQN